MKTAIETAAPPQLPAPVQRYFDMALDTVATRAHSARLTQAGEFLLRAPRLWRPFTATHRLFTRPARFVWNARIRVMPGVAIRVRDTFIGGVGSIHASAFGIFTLVSMEGMPELAVGSLQRYLAEAVWCPPALLPENGVEWEPIDGSSARAALSVGGTRASLDFHFGSGGLIERVYTGSRPRAAGREFVGTRWQGCFGDYQERSGMVIPLSGEVEWLLPAGAQPYWRGRITSATFA